MGSGHGTELNLTLKVWRQKNSKAAGSFETPEIISIEEDKLQKFYEDKPELNIFYCFIY